jgi:hypothetical protein
MRRFLNIFACCVMGLVAGFAFQALAELVWPCSGEGLSCSMTKIVGFIYIPVFAAVSLAAFLIAEFWKGTQRALAVAMLIPLIPFLTFFVCIKLEEIGNREWHELRGKDTQELVQIAIPIALTMIVPWALLLRRRGEPKAV